MYTPQNTDLFIAYCDGSKLNNGIENPIVVDGGPSFTQNPMSSPLDCDFDSVKKY